MALLFAVVVGFAPARAIAAPLTIWRLNTLEQIGGVTPQVLGAPRVQDDAVQFDGVQDGLLLATNPLLGCTAFTIEILFFPDEHGSEEQRFLHVQDEKNARALIELRADGQGHWWLDTFLRSGNSQLASINPAQQHATGRWYWAALRYDGKTMTRLVNGRTEQEGAVTFRPMVAGQVSLGVRQNKISWFRGAIREVRFHAEAVPNDQLQRVE